MIYPAGNVVYHDLASTAEKVRVWHAALKDQDTRVAFSEFLEHAGLAVPHVRCPRSGFVAHRISLPAKRSLATTAALQREPHGSRICESGPRRVRSRL